MFQAIITYTLYTALIATITSLTASILGGVHGWHSAASITASITSICLTSVSPTHALGQATAYAATLLIWAQALYRLRAYLTPPTFRPPRRIHLRRRTLNPPQKMAAAAPYYQLQQPLLCHHETCWAAAAAFSPRPKKGPDGLTPFVREQWALAAPGIPRPDMEEIIDTLNVTPAHHFKRLICWTKEIWESLPRKALLVVSVLLYILAVRPAKSLFKFLSYVDWTRVYAVVGMLVWVWFCGGETVEVAPTPRYERVVSYYLVPEVKGWSRQ